MGEAARRKASGKYPDKTDFAADLAAVLLIAAKVAEEMGVSVETVGEMLRSGAFTIAGNPTFTARVADRLRGSGPPSNGSRTLIGTTPASINARVSRFALSLSNEEPVYLPYADVEAGYISGACHLNVAHRVKHQGGERVFGWMIWCSSVLTEGEFHSVWKSPEGQLVDVTPRVDGEERILFVPDPVTKVRQQGVGAHLPMNRPNPGGFGYREPDARTRAHMAKLGMAHFTGGDV